MTHPHRLSRLRRPLRAGLLAAAGLAALAASAQKIDDVPPAVQNNVPPNFMFMIDNSGSMNNIVAAAPYDRNANYLASCPSSRLVPSGAVDLWVVGGAPRMRIGNTTYQHIAASSTSGRCFNNGATYSARLLADSSSGSSRVPGSYLDAEYSGHFLNWYFGNYGGSSGSWSDRRPGTETRMEVARRSARSAIDSLPLPGSNGRTVVRAGLSTYRSSSDGGALRIAVQDFNPALRTSLRTSIDALTPAASTPLASTLADIGRYLATGYNGTITLQRPSDAAPITRNIDDVFRLDGTDNSARSACLSGAPSCSSSSSARPIQYWCQRSSIFAVTDGRPQNDRAFNNNPYIRDYDGDCSGSNAARCVSNGAAGAWDRKTGYTYESEGSDYMDDVAKLMFDVDLRPDLAKPQPTGNRPRAKNNVTTYMIGFADAAVQSDPLLINTARQGGGRFIAATDGEDLRRAFDQVISDAITLDAAAAAVAVTNAQITAGTVGYASSYVSGSWYGDLEAYSLDINTGLQNGPVQWSARDRLNAFVRDNGAAARRIASYNGAGVPFTAANGNSFRSTTPGLSDALINYTRGDQSGEPATFRSRTYLLGDIINAEPVVVNYPSPAGPVVFQAANDGMLHAFDGRVTGSTAGQELWAYVPRLLHGKLAGRANPSFFEHEFLLDSTPVVAEVTGVGGTGRILAGGLGKGGAGYYALDITSGTAPNEAAAAAKVLWEAKPANMGYSFGPPLIVNTSAGWRVVVASGYRNDSATGGLGGDGRGHVWVLNPANGQVLKEFVTPAGFGSSSDPLGLAYLAKPQHLAAAAAVRYVYGGDLKGNVWRIDLDAATGAAPVRIGAVADASGTPQPITTAPVVAPVTGSATRLLVYFGTGQYFSVDDVPGTATPNAGASQTQTIYGLVDDTSVAAPTLPDVRGSTGANCPTSGPSTGGNGDLVCQAATQSGPTAPIVVSHNAVDLAARRGFYLDIPIAGGRVNTTLALTQGGTLVAIVNVPSNVTCQPGGSSYLFQLSGATGGAIVKSYGGLEYYPAGFTIGDARSSRSVVVTTGSGRRAVVRLSDKGTESLHIDETAGSAPTFRRIYMRPLN